MHLSQFIIDVQQVWQMQVQWSATPFDYITTSLNNQEIEKYYLELYGLK